MGRQPIVFFFWKMFESNWNEGQNQETARYYVESTPSTRNTYAQNITNQKISSRAWNYVESIPSTKNTYTKNITNQKPPPDREKTRMGYSQDITMPLKGVLNIRDQQYPITGTDIEYDPDYRSTINRYADSENGKSHQSMLAVY